ncbi:hypothetical protein DL98DRAFT_626184 [Cadophora sp. DSE1049]|nr:hypothetical protein DL98DRAFT_626184 [Cadophora sp. DSE1049]
MDLQLYTVNNGRTTLQVPFEILSLVFSKLRPQHIKVIRQVCHAFNNLSSWYLLHTAIAGSQTETLERLEAIAQHPIFSKIITDITYAVCSLRREYATRDEYYQDLRERRRFLEYKKRMPTIKQCEAYRVRYQEIYKDQAKLVKTGQDKHRIKMALHHMPNIKSLVLSGSAWKRSIHPLNRDWNPENWFIIAPSTNPFDNPWQFSHGFEIMSSALLSDGIRITSFSHSGRPYISTTLRLNDFAKPARELLHTLRKVTLYLHATCNESLTRQDEIEDCLSAAKYLEHLDLTLDEFDMNTPNLIPNFTNMLRTTTWPNLSYLSLSIDIDYGPFLGFCERHGKTLRCFQLKLCYLFGGSWGTLVEVIRSHLLLEEAWLECLSEEPFNDHAWELGDRLPDAENYLLYGGENPFKNGTLNLEFRG